MNAVMLCSFQPGCVYNGVCMLFSKCWCRQSVGREVCGAGSKGWWAETEFGSRANEDDRRACMHTRIISLSVIRSAKARDEACSPARFPSCQGAAMVSRAAEQHRKVQMWTLTHCACAVEAVSLV